LKTKNLKKARELWEEYQKAFVHSADAPEDALFARYARSKAKLRNVLGQPESLEVRKQQAAALASRLLEACQTTPSFAASQEMQVLKSKLRGIRLGRLTFQAHYSDRSSSSSDQCSQNSPRSSASSGVQSSDGEDEMEGVLAAFDFEMLNEFESGEDQAAAEVVGGCHCSGCGRSYERTDLAPHNGLCCGRPLEIGWPTSRPAWMSLPAATSQSVAAQALLNAIPEGNPGKWNKTQVAAWIEHLGQTEERMAKEFKRIAAKLKDEEWNGRSLQFLAKEDLKSYEVKDGPIAVILAAIQKLYHSGA